MNRKVRNPSDLRITFRQAVGALIGVHQTRPDIGYTIASMANSSAEACKSSEDARVMCRKYNKIAKFMKIRPRKIHYARLGNATQDKEEIDQIMACRVISFSDAGFASLPNSYSADGNFLILGRVISRGGIAHRDGGMIDHRCAKIHRACRSSLSAETHAAITAADWDLWPQVFSIEIPNRKFDVRRISPPTISPLRNRFGESPSDSQLRHEINLAG